MSSHTNKNGAGTPSAPLGYVARDRFKDSSFMKNEENVEWLDTLSSFHHFGWNESSIKMLVLNEGNKNDATKLVSTKNWTRINGMIKSAPAPENPFKNITFCGHNGLVKVGTDLKRQVLLFLHGTHQTSFFIRPFTSEKYKVSVEPAAGTLDPEKDRAVIVEITLHMFCTTVVDLEIPFLFWHGEQSQYMRMVRFRRETDDDDDTFVCPLRSWIQCEPSVFLDPGSVTLDKMDRLGRGATSIVYKGKYRGQDVACKVPKDEDGKYIENISEEAEVFGRIPHHVCIVNFFGAVSAPGCHCLVTEFCPFGSILSSMRKNKSSWTVEMKVKAMYDCACAMNFLHQEKIIHRDLKLENLLVVSLDPRSQVVCKLSDFGSSKRKIETMTKTRLTMTKGVGTSCFMAPEMLHRKPKYTNKVDVFSFGITVAGTIDGTQPYDGVEFASSFLLAMKVIEGMRPTVKNADKMPSDFVKLMRECWDDDPEQRPPFDIIVDRLEIILDSLRR